MNRRGNLIISPHLDDAALCLGASLLKKMINEVTVLNVFSLSCYTIKGDGDMEYVSRLRKKEDSMVMAEIGVQPFYLDLKDASVRDDYDNESAYMNSDISIQDDSIWRECRDSLNSFIKKYHPSCVWVPLSISTQIDHRIISEYGSTMQASNGIDVVFYEDAGYESSLIEDTVMRRVRDISNALIPHIITGDGLDRKDSLVRLYKSQVDENIIDMMSKQFALRGGERIWGTPDSLDRLKL